jgi:hypothetical protein
MPINIPGYNAPARWALQHAREERKPKMAQSIFRAPAPAQPVEMENNKDPRIGMRLKWLQNQQAESEKDQLGQAIGGSIRDFGISLLSNMGPRPQGTSSLLGNLGEAAAVGASRYQAHKDQAKVNAQEGRMMEAMQDPALLEGLTESQKRLVQALPPAAGLQALLGMQEPQDLEKVENPAQGTLDWYDNRGNLIRQTALPQAPQRQFVQSQDGTTGAVVDLTTGNVESTVELGEAAPDYQYITQDGAINVMEGQDLVKRIKLPEQGLRRGTEEYGKNLLSMNKDFRSLTPVKTWDETQVQIESAQKAYDNNQVYNNPQAQLQMVIAFAKILDPNSVVREGEIHIQTSASSLKDQLEIAFKQVSEGAVVSNFMMDNLLLGIEEVGKSRYDNYARAVAEMQPLYNAAGVGADDLGLIFGDVSEPEWMMRERPQTPQGIMNFGDFSPMASDATNIGGTSSVFNLGGGR